MVYRCKVKIDLIPPLRNAHLRKSTKNEPPDLWTERNEGIRIIKSASLSEEGKKGW